MKTFTIVEIWEQTKCQQMNGERKCGIHTYNEIFSHEKGHLAICDNMDGAWEYYAK